MLPSGVIRRTNGETELHLSGPAGAAVGLGLAVAMLTPLLFLSKLAGMQFLAVQLGFIGAIYFGFGIADGRVVRLLIEFLVAGTFLFVAAAALWADSPVVLAVAYAAHAGWDVIHHPRAVTVPVRKWYPPFCVVYDLVCAAFIVWWLPLGGVA
jgi:hypothetical protein